MEGKKKVKRVAVRLFLVTGLFAALIVAGLAQKSGLKESPRDVGLPVHSSVMWLWTQERWTGDDHPYLEIRREIDAAIAGGGNLQVLLQAYQTQAHQKPTDPQAQFRWGYLAYRMAITKPHSVDKDQILSYAGAALEDAPSPHAYEYSRLRFLAREHVLISSHLKSLGERLIERNPKDEEARYALIHVLSDTFYPPKTAAALTNADYLLREHPKNARLYAIIADIHFGEWLTHKQKSEGDNAIASWQKSFQLASPRKQRLAMIQGYIKMIQDYNQTGQVKFPQAAK